MSYKSLLFIFLVSILAFGCIPSNTFEKNIAIKNNRWASKDIKGFVFDIKDTTSEYLMFVSLRHTDAYHYSNIWLQVETTKPNDSTLKQKVELPLAETSGRWTGKGMAEIVEHKIRLSGNSATKFDQAGRYKIKLKQVMREDPLQEILSIGLRLERIPSSQ
jgi:gliding motility-associated lipoprotein GldH